MKRAIVVSVLLLLLVLPVAAEEPKPEYAFPYTPEFIWTDRLTCKVKSFQVLDAGEGRTAQLFEVQLIATYHINPRTKKPYHSDWGSSIKAPGRKGTKYFDTRMKALVACDEWLNCREEKEKEDAPRCKEIQKK